MSDDETAREAETRELDPYTFGADQPCYGCRPDHPTGMRLRFVRRGDTVTTEHVPGDLQQGPPGVMHGGLVLALADELAAWTIVGLRERFGFTASVDARFKRPVRTGIAVHGTGRIGADLGRLLKIAVELRQSGELAFAGTFTFALLDRAGAERLLGQSLPEAWAKFSRGV